MRIRPAKASEAKMLSAIAFAAKQHWGYSAEAMKSWESMLTVSSIAIEMNPTFVAQDRDVMGFYMLSHGVRWELEHMWISPQYLRRGVGRKLLLHGIEYVRSQGGSTLHIDADPNAESFYRACGAVVVDKVAAPLTGDPQRVRPQMILHLR